eukprot:1244585-Rhodomonas_salina.1
MIRVHEGAELTSGRLRGWHCRLTGLHSSDSDSLAPAPRPWPGDQSPSLARNPSEPSTVLARVRRLDVKPHDIAEIAEI